MYTTCEQYQNGTEENGWFHDESGKSAAAVLNQDIPIELVGSPEDIGFKLGYGPRHTDIYMLLEDHRENDQGRLVMELMSSLNLVAKNSGGIPTFERIYGDGRVAQSHIQITLVSESIAQQFMGWIVLEDYNGSLHRFITYNVTDRIDITANHRNGPKWSWKKYDAKKLKNYLASTDLPLTDVNATEGAVRLDKFLNEACDSCMPKGMYKGGKLLAYWWTQNIANFKKECPSHRRKCKSNRQRNNTALQTENLERYNEARKKLKWEIQRSKRECWGGLCKQVEKDPWGLPFKLVTKN
ncbi:hypothetical protein QTP88_027079 [Uroleucon formosanum]